MVHHNFKRGTTVFVILKDGSRFTDKYLETKSGRLILAQHTCVITQVRSITIYRPKEKKE